MNSVFNRPPQADRARARLLLAAAACFLTTLAAAQSVGTGTIEGRVSSASGSYFENARISVEGAGLETFTDAAGFYRLTNVPAGTAQVRAFFTGAETETISVTVSPGQTVQRDIQLGSFPERSV